MIKSQEDAFANSQPELALLKGSSTVHLDQTRKLDYKIQS